MKMMRDLCRKTSIKRLVPIKRRSLINAGDFDLVSMNAGLKKAPGVEVYTVVIWTPGRLIEVLRYTHSAVTNMHV